VDPVSAIPATPRRIQARGEATRLRILEATLACIVDDGYAQTSTVSVCARSGASRGSLLHQFPTRAALMSAAVGHLFAQLTTAFVDAFAAIEPDPTRSLARRVDVAGTLLRAAYADRRLAAVLDIYAAARTDAELMAALRPVAARHRNAVRAVARRLFPMAATSKRAARRLDVVFDALQGLAFRSVVLAEGADETLAGAKDLIIEAFGAGQQGG
jgi:AcrR family transcriptional regulator